MPHLLPLARLIAVASICCAAGAAADTARDLREEARARQWRVPEIIEAVGLREGHTVADIGCGDGFLTLRLASAVGMGGRVFAVDIDERALDRLKARVEEAGRKNVTIVKSGEADPMLPSNALDGAIVLRAYHEFSRHREMLSKIFTALRPGGRLVIADVAPPAGNQGRRDSQVLRHVLGHEIVATELTEAGFRVVTSSPAFSRSDTGETIWLIGAEKPASRPPSPDKSGRD